MSREEVKKMVRVSVTRPIQHEIKDGNGRVIESTYEPIRSECYENGHQITEGVCIRKNCSYKEY